ncbi:MAG: hypothetical protein JWM52_600 [Candidatus Saccharibacteria bacterium]|nr:hypothetical protein [Candidatus Saccharibacteria bacterium]
MTTAHESESESSAPIALDDSIFSRKMLDGMADRNGAAIAAERRVLPIEMKPQYKQIPVHETVQSSPGWQVTIPPHETKPEYDPEASARNAERYIQTNIIKLEDGSFGIHIGGGAPIPLGQFLAGIGKDFYKFWDMSTQETRERSSEYISKLVVKYLGEDEEEPTETLFGDDIFKPLSSEKEESKSVDLGIFDEPEQDGAAIDVGTAAYAFGEIMDGYSKANQAAHIRENEHELVRKHGRAVADRIIAAKTREGETALAAVGRHIETLVGAEQLRAAGANEPGIERVRQEVKSVFKSKFDRTGPEIVEMRNRKKNNLNRLSQAAIKARKAEEDR